MVTKPRVLITGGAGFIGSALSNLLCKSYDVLSVDNLRAGNWNRVVGPVVKVDLDLAQASLGEISRLLSGVEYVFHLAAVKLHNEVNSNLSIIENNIVATNNLLQACTSEKVKKVVFTSSLYSYGHMYLPILNEDTTLEPKTAYGVSKVAGEGLLKVEAELGGFEYAIARLFFIYGPNQFASGGYKSVIVRNFERLLNGQPAIVHGKGDQILDYVFIDDCVHYLKELMFSEFSGTVNISSGIGVSISQLTEEMIQVAGSGRIAFGDQDWTAGTSRVGDNKLLTNLFPDYIQTSRTDGLATTFKHLRETLGSQ